MSDIIVVAVLNAKGGVGKTLFATQLAVRACEDFSMVALIDLDPSAGARSWFESRGEQDGEIEQPTAFVGVSNPADAVETAERAGYEIAFLDGANGRCQGSDLRCRPKMEGQRRHLWFHQSHRQQVCANR